MTNPTLPTAGVAELLEGDSLSQDAKIVAGTLFGAKSTVTFHMQESKPSPRAQAAIDELLAADLIRESREHHGKEAVTYRTTTSLFPAFQWVAKRMSDGLGEEMNFPLTVPIKANLTGAA